jgi:hypothetical protein
MRLLFLLALLTVSGHLRLTNSLSALVLVTHLAAAAPPLTHLLDPEITIPSPNVLVLPLHEGARHEA